jgi:hypothetical protein
MVNELESKCINCLEFFSFNEDSTEKNNDLNLELLKKYCTLSFIKLKNNIDTKEILINDEVFLSLYNKLKAIKDYEINFFNENSNKYKMLNSFFLPFTQEIKNMSIDLNNILTRYLNKDIYAKFKEDITKNTVDVVQKEDVNRFMFENLNVTKMNGSSLLKPEENTSKNSLTPNINLRILPSILLFNEQKNSNKQNLNSNMNANNNNNTNNANSINNNMGYQNYKQQNFTITSPIQFSKAGNMNMNFSLFNSNSMNTLGNMNSLNSYNSINNSNNAMVNNMNAMNSLSKTNMNNINSINNINNTPIKSTNNINSMNNINSAVLNNLNNINSLNNIGNKVINNFSNVNSFSNTNNMNNISSMNSVTRAISSHSMVTLNNMNSIPNINDTNNMNTMNPISNMNSVTNNNNNNSILNNVNSVANNPNNNSILNSMNSVTNVNNTNVNANPNNNTVNNMNILNTVSNNNSSILNNMNSINNSNSNNTVNGMKSFLFLQNVTECSNRDVSMSKDQEKDKKTEKNERMDVEESGDTPPTQNSPNMKNTEINYSQAKIDEIKANLTDKNSVYASPIFSKKALINVHLSPSKVKETYENKSAITSSTYIQKKNLFSQTNINEQISDNSNTINKIDNQPAQKNSINDASIFGGKLIDVLNNEITNNSNNNNNNTSIFQENTEKKDEIILSQKAQNISSDLNSNSNISNNTNNINSVANANASLLSQRSEKQEVNMSLNNAPSCFMYPVFKTNIIKGAIDKVTVQEIKINFSQFSEEDPILTEFPSGGAYCNYENFFYFSGGQEYIKEASKLFLSISKKDSNQNPNKLPSMINPHWNHSMIADKEKIYVIGGYNSNKCEVYDIQAKTWSELPDLFSPERQRSMLFIEKNFLYCFMGLSQNGILDSVERLNLDNTQTGWERINVDNSDNLILKFYGAGIIRMSDENKILFIGGKKENNNEEVYKRSIYEFSLDDFKMTLSDFKIENDLEFVENKLYPIDETDYGNFINIGDGYLISMPSLAK